MCKYNKRDLSKGLTFLEIVISLSLFTIAMLGFFQIFNTALDSSYRAHQETVATNLGRALMAEIMAKDFEDPETPGNPLGDDPNEDRYGSGANTPFDDVDDYDGFNDGPPPRTVGDIAMDGAGTTPNYSDFGRTVVVVYCEDNAGTIVGVAGPTDWKRVTVTVSGGHYVRDINIVEVRTE